MLLYHTGFDEIREPDVHHGRVNADFGQGFYLTADEDFAHRWARERTGRETIVNVYEFDPEGLEIVRLSRDAAWYDVIFANRMRRPDPLPVDAVIGPIANDTIYDTFGILTSGLVTRERAVQLLCAGPCYEQIALKTERAAKQLRFLRAERLTSGQVRAFRTAVAAEEREYQRLFAAEIAKMTD